MKVCRACEARSSGTPNSLLEAECKAQILDGKVHGEMML